MTTEAIENNIIGLVQRIHSMIYKRELDTFCGIGKFSSYWDMIYADQGYADKLRSFVRQNHDRLIKEYKITGKIDKNIVVYDFIAPTYFGYESPKITQNEEILEEKVKRAVGRPKGSKNKEKEVKMKLPKYQCNNETLVDAMRCILWYRPYLLASDVVSYLDISDDLKRFAYVQLNKNKEMFEVHTKYVLGKRIQTIEAKGSRRGYFYGGKLVSLTDLANECGKSKQILTYRINKKKMHHTEAMNENLDTNMARR